MPFFDATVPLKANMMSFPGDPAVKIEGLFDRKHGDPFNLALLSLGTHSGTHIDAPSHYLDGGLTVDEIPPETLLGPGIVLDMRNKSRIDLVSLKDVDLSSNERVLFKTDNSPWLNESSFRDDFVYLTEDAARHLVSKGIRLVGIDYLSIERYGNVGAPVHRILLEAQVLIVEGIDLSEVPPGPCDIFCLPLRVELGDGAPARLFVRTYDKK